MTHRRIRWLGVLLGAVLLALGGCVVIPTSGPVEHHDQQHQTSEPGVEIAPAPPPPGASPSLIVEGFLHAMATYQPDYGAARKYLTTQAAAVWRPESGVQVYADTSPSVGERAATLAAPLVGRLDPHGTYTTVDGAVRVDFGLVREAGQWRVSTPPEGLLISAYLFANSYVPVNLYFLDPTGTTLVPDLVFQPRSLRGLSAAANGLVRGPSNWLAPAVTTAFPAGSHFVDGRVVVDTAGVAAVNLDAGLRSLDAGQRARLAAQLVWTLSGFEGVTGIRINAGGEPLVVTQADASGLISRSAMAAWAPIHPQLSTQLFVATRTGLARIVDGTRQTSAEAVPGPLGRLSDINGLALSRDGQQAAVTLSGGSLLFGQVGDAEPTGLDTGGAVVRPQFDRFDALWTFTKGPKSEARYWVSGKLLSTSSPATSDASVVAFKIAPDGVRVAIVAVTGGRQVLGMARIVRGNRQVRIEGWQPLLSPAPGQPQPIDVGWATDSILLVARTDAAGSGSIVRLDAAGSQSQEIGPSDLGHPAGLAVSPGSPAYRAAVVSESGDAYRYDAEFRWPLLWQGVSQAAYPG